MISGAHPDAMPRFAPLRQGQFGEGPKVSFQYIYIYDDMRPAFLVDATSQNFNCVTAFPMVCFRWPGCLWQLLYELFVLLFPLLPTLLLFFGLASICICGWTGFLLLLGGGFWIILVMARIFDFGTGPFRPHRCRFSLSLYLTISFPISSNFALRPDNVWLVLGDSNTHHDRNVFLEFGIYDKL